MESPPSIPATAPVPRASSARKNRLADAVACLILAAGIWLVYWPVTGFDFVNMDDTVYVTNNPQIKAGLTWSNVQWASHAIVNANWHPITLLSHMLDCQWYGPKAGGHHVTSVVWHTLDSLLLFIVLRTAAGRRWPAFFVAALFAWHPMHVESVAWISERKDVLSAFFGLLALLAYVGYARRGAKAYYWLALAWFALGLMTKPMLVTLPFIFFLLDYWPLHRMREFSLTAVKHLALEKLPFLALAAGGCGVTLWAQKTGHAVVAMDVLPLGARLAHAALSYYLYIGKILWPANLAVYYPYHQQQWSGLGWLAGAGLAVLSFTAFRLRKFPFVAVGWFWFVGMLVPVIGLVQVGGQAMADRYSYLPSIGLFILAAYGLSALADRYKAVRPGAIVLATLVLAGCLAATGQQVGCWRNSEALYRHAMTATRENWVAANNLGAALQKQGRLREALEYYQEAVTFDPGYGQAHCNLGEAYERLHQPEKALGEFQTALKLNRGNARAHYFLGNLLLGHGDTGGALEQYQEGATAQPEDPDLQYQLATVMLARNDIEEAIQHYRTALRYKPDWLEALNNLSWLLATAPDARYRNGKEAVQLAAQAVTLTETNNPGALDTLAAAYAESGQFTEAAHTASLAIKLARVAHQEKMAADIEPRLQLYEKSQPFRDLTPPSATAPPPDTDPAIK